jgi:hypothetical protein
MDKDKYAKKLKIIGGISLLKREVYSTKVEMLAMVYNYRSSFRCNPHDP